MTSPVLSDRYELRRRVGSGGVGDVWEAYDRGTSRIVAVKIVRAVAEGRYEAVARFDREITAVGRLANANIAAAYDWGREDDKLYLVTEFVDGLSLDDLLRNRATRGNAALPYDAALDVVAQACSGLIAAHGAGIIHRDLKPANLMVTPRAVVKIVDFGIAFLTTADDNGVRLSDVDTPLGSLHYAAPEQLHGRPVDGRADLYTLGCTLYEMLAGARAFPATRPDVLMSTRAANTYVPLAARRADVPVPVVVLVDDLLALEPERRPLTAGTVLDRIQSIRADMAAGRVEIAAPIALPAEVAAGPAGRVAGAAAAGGAMAAGNAMAAGGAMAGAAMADAAALGAGGAAMADAAAGAAVAGGSAEAAVLDAAGGQPGAGASDGGAMADAAGYTPLAGASDGGAMADAAGYVPVAEGSAGPAMADAAGAGAPGDLAMASVADDAGSPTPGMVPAEPVAVPAGPVAVPVASAAPVMDAASPGGPVAPVGPDAGAAPDARVPAVPGGGVSARRVIAETRLVDDLDLAAAAALARAARPAVAPSVLDVTTVEPPEVAAAAPPAVDVAAPMVDAAAAAFNVTTVAPPEVDAVRPPGPGIGRIALPEDVHGTLEALMIAATEERPSPAVGHAAPVDPGQFPTVPQPPGPPAAFPGQAVPVSPAFPGQAVPVSPAFPGQAVPVSPPVPAGPAPFPGQPVPPQYPGQPAGAPQYPGQPAPGQFPPPPPQYPGQPAPGQFPPPPPQYPGQPAPGQYPAAPPPVPGQPGQYPAAPPPVPGQPGQYPAAPPPVPGQPGQYPAAPPPFGAGAPYAPPPGGAPAYPPAPGGQFPPPPASGSPPYSAQPAPPFGNPPYPNAPGNQYAPPPYPGPPAQFPPPPPPGGSPAYSPPPAPPFDPNAAPPRRTYAGTIIGDLSDLPPPPPPPPAPPAAPPGPSLLKTPLGALPSGPRQGPGGSFAYGKAAPAPPGSWQDHPSEPVTEHKSHTMAWIIAVLVVLLLVAVLGYVAFRHADSNTTAAPARSGSHATVDRSGG